MFLLLLLVVAALAGALLLQATGQIDLSTLPALTIAAGVLAALIFLYAVAVRSDSAERRSHSLAIIGVALLGLLVSANGWLPVTSVTGFVRSIIGGPGSDASGPTSLRRTASVRVRKQDDGKFLVHGAVNGQPIDMIVDTGAVAIILKQSDAIAAGIDIAGLSFDTPLQTANGTSFLAPAHLKIVKIGPIEVSDIEALVAKPGTISESLLGMSFLKRLASYEFAGDFVTLRQ